MSSDSESELDNLINYFHNSVSLTENKLISINMPPVDTTVNFQLLKLYVDTIATYNGNPDVLEIFINSCDFLIKKYGNNNIEDPINEYLVRVVISKLTGRAQLLIGTRPELSTWPLIKNCLRLSFGDQRNIDCLEQDLISLRPQKSESPLDFGRRIQVVRSKLASKISSTPDSEIDKPTKVIYLKQYDSLALKTFIRGLTGQLQSIIRLRKPDSLELAMTYVTEEENFKYTLNFQTPQYSQNFQQKVHPQQQMPTRQNFIPQQPIQYNQFRPPQQMQSSFFQKPKFVSQPIAIQPRPIKQNFPTNAQVFGPPKNVFKPTGQKPTNQPEPMSTTSKTPSFRQQQNMQNTNAKNHFRPFNQNNFTSQELYQMDEEFNYDPYYDQSDMQFNYDYNDQQTDIEPDVNEKVNDQTKNFQLDSSITEPT